MSRMFMRRKETRERRAREKKREDEIFVFFAFFIFFLALVFTREVSFSLFALLGEIRKS